jgi:hypothetical protein
VENFPPRTWLSTGHTVTPNQLTASTDIFITEVKRFHFTFKVVGRIYRQLTQKCLPLITLCPAQRTGLRGHYL